MPAKNEKQRRLFGIALGVRRGTIKRSEVSGDALEIADGKMSTDEIEKMASKKESVIITSFDDFVNERSSTDSVE